MEIRRALRFCPFFLIVAANASCSVREEIVIEKIQGEGILFKVNENKNGRNKKYFESITVSEIKNVKRGLQRSDYPLWEVVGYTKPGCESRIFFGSEPVGFITSHAASKLKRGEMYSVVAQISGNFTEKKFVF
ncbi:hypothetical protein [Novosphingobium sp. AAP93]|uniref:hypothetical protein n=1 Tax=Novosphingobium sp. AAP93 TaxID=1523427 RepID=UPI0012E27604|nr:hypothetical protein [Novosphingobium sp. AAP93]